MSPFKASDWKTGSLRQLWQSPWTRWIGVRYLKSKKSSRFLSFITVLSVMGVGIGVTALIVVMSVMDGFERELKKRLLSSDLHVLVMPTKKVPGFDSGFVSTQAFRDAKLEELMTKDPRVERVEPVIATEAIMRTGTKVTGIVMKGVSSESLNEVRKKLTETADTKLLQESEAGESFRLPGLLIGQELAFMIGLIPGDRVTLISPTETQGPLESVPRMKRFVVEGIYSTGLPEQELHSVFAEGKTVRSFLRKRSVVSQWEIRVRKHEEAAAVAASIRKTAPEFRVKDWMELNSNLFASLKLERLAMFIILVFIIIVASFSIVTTLTLMVLEKKKEISILKAMGARKSQIGAIFLAEGLLIGFIGVFGGVSLAGVLCLILARTEVITLPDIYYDRTLPVTFDPLYYALTAVAALVIVWIACQYPSRRAARLHPIEGIRG